MRLAKITSFFLFFFLQTFDFLPLQGEILLRDPEMQLYFYEYYGMDPNMVPASPYRMFFGKWVRTT
jgi:hypothetical protein